ncbi:hypothetical protein HI914_00948 [Erysiphe necator]|uniref:Uncharacterized protein n=1 Tax=Uncinula necator TaxID=52586 RepID=A0A0B1PBC1_UNCNE|nr:hypothetical protein HI914_00948 [Erysiphe necator]KHJ35548.1 hypothetical protein EV44_g2255 [Erysiphe necator]
MVYDWGNKEEMCYRMYIEEKRSLEDIMEYMKENHKFNPSKRAFQTQFKKWDFPSKQHPAYKNPALVKRVKELWDCNASQREMLQILNGEGFVIKERELMRVRAKNRWLLRVPNNVKNKKQLPQQEVLSQLQNALFSEESLIGSEIDSKTLKKVSTQSLLDVTERPVSPPLSPEVLKKRQERLLKLQNESAERWASRKRRRRTRGWAGIPADPPGPPRFPSETTIDESKAALNLNHQLYRDIRSRFQKICEDAAIIKKTVAGPERWEAAKHRLIQDSQHLQSVFWLNNENQDAKKLALDVVCSDVTKRMRTLERRMTIAEAKNALGVNPEQSRQLRDAFYKVLKADHFTSKLEAGEEHWKKLKNQWIQGSELLLKILAPGETDPRHQNKIKAVEVICRDVMKRLRDDQTKRDPLRRRINNCNSISKPLEQCDESTSSKLNSSLGTSLFKLPSQAQTNQSHLANNLNISSHQLRNNSLENLLEIKLTSVPLQMMPRNEILVDHNNNIQIDPSLLIATTNNSLLHNQNFKDHFDAPQYRD